MLSKDYNGNTLVLAVLPSFFPSDLFLAKAHKYFQDWKLTHIVKFFFLSFGKKEKKKNEWRLLRILDGVIHLNIYDSSYL